MLADTPIPSTTRSRWRLPLGLSVLLLACAGFATPARAQTYYFVADYDGAQELPPNASTGTGFAYFELDATALTLTYWISYTGLSGAATAVHVHGFSPPGVNSAVLVAPAPGASPITGTVAAQASWVPNFLAGLAYSNIHTASFPGGEIRGQILRIPPQVELAASFDGSQESPPNGSTASATGAFVLDIPALTMSYNISYSGLQGSLTAVHVHGFAPPGTNAAILFAPPIGSSPIVGSASAQAAWVPQILAGLSYSNLHSTAFPGGEIRGQILRVRSPGTPFCEPGQGGVAACPCGNAPAGSFRGCDNSLATGGASISGSGTASLAADTLVLGASGIGSKGLSCAGSSLNLLSLLLQGTSVTPAGLLFNDGVRCFSGTLKRIEAASSLAGVFTSTVSISARSSALGDPLSAGLTRYYGVWHRDSCSSFCPTAGSNASNSYAVTWRP